MKAKLLHLKERYAAMTEPVKASLWYTVSNVLLKGVALLSTPIFTRIMSQEEYGAYTVYQSWYAIIVIITTLNLHQGGFNKGLITYSDKKDEFTYSLLALTSILILGWAGIYYANTDWWDSLIGLTPALMTAMFIELLGMAAVEFWSARERFDFKYKQYVFVSIATTVLSVLLGFASVSFSRDRVQARVFSDVFAKVLFGFVLMGVLFARGKKGFSLEYWKYSLRFNLPLMPHFFSTFILNQADRIMIGNMVGNAQAACYSIAYTISSMMLLITGAIDKALVPYIYRMIGKEQYADIRKNTKGLFVLVGSLSILVMIFAPEIILIFGGTSYADAIWIIPPVAAAMFFIFCYSMFGSVEYYFQSTGMVALASCISAVLNIVLNYIFITMFGYYAAGYTTLFCYILLALLHYLNYLRIKKARLPDDALLFDMKIILTVSGGVLLIMGLMLMTYKQLLVRYGLLVILIVLAIVNRKNIMKVYQNLQ